MSQNILEPHLGLVPEAVMHGSADLFKVAHQRGGDDGGTHLGAQVPGQRLTQFVPCREFELRITAWGGWRGRVQEDTVMTAHLTKSGGAQNTLGGTMGRTASKTAN